MLETTIWTAKLWCTGKVWEQHAFKKAVLFVFFNYFKWFLFQSLVCLRYFFTLGTQWSKKFTPYTWEVFWDTGWRTVCGESHIGACGRIGLGWEELWCLPWSWWGGSEVSCFPSSVFCGIADCHFALQLEQPQLCCIPPLAFPAEVTLHPEEPAACWRGVCLSPGLGWLLNDASLHQSGTGVHSCSVTCWLVWALPKLPEISTCTRVFQHVLSCGISYLIGNTPSKEPWLFRVVHGHLNWTQKRIW